MSRTANSHRKSRVARTSRKAENLATRVTLSAFDDSSDEVLDGLLRLTVVVLNRWRLHEVTGRRQDGTTDPTIHGNLRCADGIDDDPGAVRGVPHLKFVLKAQWDVPECTALETDEGPLAVVKPCDVVGRPDVNIAFAEIVANLRGDRLRLGDLLRLETIAF